MESNDSESTSDEVKETTHKKRRSLFLPPDVTVSEPTKTSDENYFKKLKLEEETWRQIYNEQKQQNEKLRKLEINKPQLIDYSLFDEEEIKYLNAAPDIAKYVEEAEDLQNIIKVISIQCEVKRQQFNHILDRIDNACSDITSNLNNI